MNNDNITCKDVIEHICENLGEELNSPKCASIKKHLEECSNCSKYMQSIFKTINFYKNYNAEFSEGAHKRLIEALGLKNNK